jgi:ATP-dependent Clp protease protease subunit
MSLMTAMGKPGILAGRMLGGDAPDRQSGLPGRAPTLAAARSGRYRGLSSVGSGACGAPPVEEVRMPAAAINYQRTREMTIDELLLDNRVVFLIGDINHASAARVMMQMLYLENQKRGQEISFYINSPGGSVDDTLALYDTMRFLSSPVATFCIGRAYSGAAVLLTAGKKGRRYILPHAKVMIHQPYGGVTGQAEDIRIQAEQIIKAKADLNRIIAQHTGQPIERVQQDGERDKYFNAEEAKAYGLVDEVLAEAPKEDLLKSASPQ